MATNDKPTSVNDIAHTDLRRLSADQLQEQLEAYFAQHDDATAQQLVRELVHELQVHQIELEMQNRELKESQIQLEEARDRYADLYDFAPVSYLTLDDTGIIREINLTGANLLGQERANVLGKPFNLWLKQGGGGRDFFSHLKQVRESGQVETTELKLTPYKSTPLNVRLETIAKPAPIDDKLFYRCIVIDITARKQAEQEVQNRGRQLRVISDAMPTFIGYVNQQERYQFVNKNYEVWFKLPREQIIGLTVRELLGEQYYTEVAEYIHTALSGNAVNFEMTYPFAGLEHRQFNASYIPDFDDNGAVLGYYTLIRDVTEQRQTELQDKIHLLETAHVARINTMGEMVAELAHELNQPLAAISFYGDAVTRMLGKDKSDFSDVQDALRKIKSQSERVSEVIKRIREFVSKRELQSNRIQINELVEEVIKLVEIEARWHAVELRLELAEGIPQINVDRILIEQVVLNLARNAIDAMDAMDAIERNKRCVTIKTAVTAQHEIVVTVEDTGPGLSVTQIEKIFEPFYTTKTQGIGMGLAISSSIIKAHHGRIWAAANDSGGTSFVFTLPIEA